VKTHARKRKQQDSPNEQASCFRECESLKTDSRMFGKDECLDGVSHSLRYSYLNTPLIRRTVKHAVIIGY